jgi:hypothetical protein
MPLIAFSKASRSSGQPSPRASGTIIEPERKRTGAADPENAWSVLRPGRAAGSTAHRLSGVLRGGWIVRRSFAAPRAERAVVQDERKTMEVMLSVSTLPGFRVSRLNGSVEFLERSR